MKIMLFCYAEQAKIELLNWTRYLTELPEQFIVTPIVRLKDKANYAGVMSQLSQSGRNILVDPVYLMSSDSSLKNLFNPKVLLSDFQAILRVLERSKPDVVVCFYVSHAYPLAVLKKISNFSLCVVAMGSDVNLENSPFQKMTRKFIYRNCDLIFAYSWQLKDRIEKEHRCEVIVVPSSTDPSFFRPLNVRMKLRQKWGIQPGKKVVLTVCRLNRNKGVDVLLKSVKLLDSENVDLLVVGEGEERSFLETLSASLGMQKTVTFLGFRDREELLELYNLADVFALASYSEGLPRVLIEAMACGCIPVVTNVGSTTRVVADGLNGFTVRPGNHDELAQRIKHVLSQSEEKSKLMQDRARRAVKQEFDSRQFVKKFISNVAASARTVKK